MRPAGHVHVSRLRKLVGRERLETVAPGYVPHVEPDELGAARFERLHAEGDAHGALSPVAGRAESLA